MKATEKTPPEVLAAVALSEAMGMSVRDLIITAGRAVSKESMTLHNQRLYVASVTLAAALLRLEADEAERTTTESATVTERMAPSAN